MSCPVCDGTMQNVGSRSFWCHRCGTIKSNEYDTEPPAWIRQIMGVPSPPHNTYQQAFRTVHFEIVTKDGDTTLRLLKIGD